LKIKWAQPSSKKRDFGVSKTRNAPPKRKRVQLPMKKKRVRCFKNEKYTLKKKWGLALG
jgi:hypothetical protein